METLLCKAVYFSPIDVVTIPWLIGLSGDGDPSQKKGEERMVWCSRKVVKLFHYYSYLHGLKAKSRWGLAEDLVIPLCYAIFHEHYITMN